MLGTYSLATEEWSTDVFFDTICICIVFYDTF